jgi:hypothetical protein
MPKFLFVVLAVSLSISACDGAQPPSPSTLAVSKQALAGDYSKGTDDGPGYHGEGGPLDGAGVYGRGGGDGPGIIGVGAGFDGSGIVGQGSGYGSGGVFAGGENGPGVYAYAGQPSTATERRAALVADGGDIRFNATVPASSAPIANAVTSISVVKAWASLATEGGGSSVVRVLGGLNVEGATAANGTHLQVWIAADLTGPCAAVVTGEEYGLIYSATCNGGLIEIKAIDAGGALGINGAFPMVNFRNYGPVRLAVSAFGVQGA